MNTHHTDITIVLDRSGSMANVVNDTIGGFNRLLEDQRKAPGTAAMTLHQFDHEFETVTCAKDVNTAPFLTTATFQPRGSTALLDAIGRAINETGKRLDATAEKDRAGKVVFVIITDGEENSSHEFTHARVMEQIKHQREKYAWEFVFLGANQNAIQAGTAIGVTAANSMTYASNAIGTSNAFGSTSKNLFRMRAGDTSTMAYSADDRAKQHDAGAAPEEESTT